MFVRLEQGLRIILGKEEASGWLSPDVLIERRPHGWVIFVHPGGAGDASGMICLLDNGRSYVLPENGLGPTLELVTDLDQVPELDEWGES